MQVAVSEDDAEDDEGFTEPRTKGDQGQGAGIQPLLTWGRIEAASSPPWFSLNL